MTPEEYLERAEGYRRALETATSLFIRHHLEIMEQSYRILAESGRTLRKSGVIVNALDELGKSKPQ